ncbi:ABC transporter ATP-binding protein [Marinilongibacter aquaticus]|uniref:ABC transporter ATP-binding protein n=1 Tax=Marinilongibacter aquaticus TaxID=2975157 RepID=UPI0021BD2B14|nr:ABC transporter ATP-binding protein [Marinilongibacter aquaticus]UBM60152.1 ABC transporter ATP-binding protein [Marinilongibacter aquaticus]
MRDFVSEKILSVENLSFSLEERPLIQKLSVELKKHEILAFLGQSGSGKSTLLKLIAGLLEPESGELTIEGERITPPSEKLIPGHDKIKIVRQDNPLFPNISLRENIAYELRFYNKEYRTARVERLLELTRLTDVADHLPRFSSEGEQQRAAIARALADEPALLLLDEPFSNLDYTNKQRLKQEVQQIVHEEDMACIFVTHDIYDVFGLASNLAILRAGEITQFGEPLHVYAKPNSEYEAGLTGAYNCFGAVWAKAHLGLKVKGKSVVVRPENITLGGKVEAEIKAVTKRGFYTELVLEKAGMHFSVFTMQSDFSIGEKTGFAVASYHELA